MPGKHVWDTLLYVFAIYNKQSNNTYNGIIFDDSKAARAIYINKLTLTIIYIYIIILSSTVPVPTPS